MCRGKNIVCQRAASAALPVECLLAILELPDASPADRALLCSFLITGFVEHDFVFPTIALTPSQARVVSIQNEHTFVTQAGRLFNDTARYIRSDIPPATPFELRKLLWNFMHVHLYRLQLVPKRGESLYFQIALLKLTHTLLLRGFFAEPELAGTQMVVTSAFTQLALGTTLSHDDLEVLLVTKLRDTIDDYMDYSTGLGLDNMDLIEASMRLH